MAKYDYEERLRKAEYRIEFLKNINIEAQSVNEYSIADSIKEKIIIAEKDLEEILKEQ